ncbi:hypothetical protein [Winogradskya humida]|uniref:Uncharacterized protein n=1 Tax=Winogradskya humida TaxID=113566 RepID=A0ABQ3ZJL8_9ACTN|nr:hypothetical protein [Actinoplanes humidus]GIE18784.1 hypothetical protein Ahu01nite_018860 [Actinoplanes humidus]
MATIDITADDLVVNVEGLDKLWALKSSLTIPLTNVRGATPDPSIAHEWKGVRTAGTYVPGVIVAGSFRSEGERVFWDVKNPAKALVIELADERYARLVIEVDDPRATAELIESAKRN